MTFEFSFEKKNMYKDTGESIVMVSQNILYDKFPRINTSNFLSVIINCPILISPL